MQRIDDPDVNQILTIVEAFTDCNDNGIPDEQDVAECDGSPWCSDCNENGIPDECEDDTDADGVIDDCDNCPNEYNPGQEDSDGDGVGDVCDELVPIPTVTVWGLVLLTLLLLTVAKIYFGRHQMTREQA